MGRDLTYIDHSLIAISTIAGWYYWFILLVYCINYGVPIGITSSAIGFV